MRAAKESEKNLIHVIKVVPKKVEEKVENSRSVLKFSAQHSSCKDCAVCRSKSVETLKDLKRHFEARHGVAITLRSISTDPEEPKIKPPAHEGTMPLMLHVTKWLELGSSRSSEEWIFRAFSNYELIVDTCIEFPFTLYLLLFYSSFLATMILQISNFNLTSLFISSI